MLMLYYIEARRLPYSRVKYVEVAGESRFALHRLESFPRSIALKVTGLKGPTELDKSTKIRSSLPSLHKRSACKELATLELPKAVFWLWSHAELESNGLLSALSTLASNDYFIEAGPETLFQDAGRPVHAAHLEHYHGHCVRAILQIAWLD